MEINNLTKVFKDEDKSLIAVNDVSLTFEAGKITGLIGYNGSGKTTIFNLILNFINKDSGKIKIANLDIDNSNRLEFGFIARSDEFNRDEKILSNIINIGRLYGLKKQEIINKTCELAAFFELKADLKKDTFKKISKGNAQKVSLIQMFINPYLKYLLLDEPFDGLDPIITKKIVDYISQRRQEYITIITSHRLDVIEEMVDNFYVIKDGSIVFDSKKDKIDNIFQVLVNPEVNHNKLIAEFIKKVEKTKKGILIELYQKADFAKLTKLLVKDKNYKMHKFIEKN